MAPSTIREAFALRKAAAAIGDQRYAAICREMNFPSDSIDDIPDRDALKKLLGRTEAETAGNAGDGNSAVNIAEARGRLLQAARKAADKTRKRLADIITEASDGKLSLDSLKNLTDADVPLVEAASKRIG